MFSLQSQTVTITAAYVSLLFSLAFASHPKWLRLSFTGSRKHLPHDLLISLNCLDISPQTGHVTLSWGFSPCEFGFDLRAVQMEGDMPSPAKYHSTIPPYSSAVKGSHDSTTWGYYVTSQCCPGILLALATKARNLNSSVFWDQIFGATVTNQNLIKKVK
jgi:hypothetical protein